MSESGFELTVKCKRHNCIVKRNLADRMVHLARGDICDSTQFLAITSRNIDRETAMAEFIKAGE